jgi:hypothetical protein
MKHLGVVSALLTIAVLMQSSAAFAGGVTRYNQELNVSGRVLDTHTVIVNDDYIILEIASNTEADVVPRVFRYEPGIENELSLSEKVYEQYRILVPAGSSRPGILYKYGDPQPLWTPLSKTPPSPTVWSPLHLQPISTQMAQR